MVQCVCLFVLLFSFVSFTGDFVANLETRVTQEHLLSKKSQKFYQEIS